MGNVDSILTFSRKEFNYMEGWLMDSGRLPMYSLARRLELEATA
jgi:hypothetical protein